MRSACSVVGRDEGHIRGMAVRPAPHGVDVAGKLIRSVETELRNRACTRISLDATVPLQRAMRFYEKQDFRRSGRIGDFFGMELVEYLKPLSTSPPPTGSAFDGSTSGARLGPYEILDPIDASGPTGTGLRQRASW